MEVLTNWTKEYMGFKPEEFMRLNSKTWMQRRKITEESEGSWSCESRKLSNEEYQVVQNQIEDVKRIVADLTDTAKYEEGYNAAMILMGQET